jgi:hypothetical protein
MICFETGRHRANRNIEVKAVTRTRLHLCEGPKLVISSVMGRLSATAELNDVTVDEDRDQNTMTVGGKVHSENARCSRRRKLLRRRLAIET